MQESNRFSLDRVREKVLVKMKNMSAGLIGFICLVVVPTLVVFLYLLIFHSPMYEAETKFAVRSGSDMPIGGDFASLLFNPLVGSSQDARLINEYVASSAIYDRMDKDLELTAHFSNRKKDVYSRLAGNPTNREKREYWESVSSTNLDPESGILTFNVRAYSPEVAKAISEKVLRLSEELVNQMNERARKDTLDLALKEVQLAREKVASTQAALTSFRDLHGDIDLKSTAGGLQSLILELEGERAKVQAQIKELESYMRSDAAPILGLKKRAQAIDNQLLAERNRLTSLDSNKSLNGLVSEFEKLTTEHDFAQKQLVSAMAALESARVQLLSKNRYVVTVTQAELPDESTYPRVIVFSLIFGLAMSFIYGLGYLIVASIKEHVGY